MKGLNKLTVSTILTNGHKNQVFDKNLVFQHIHDEQKRSKTKSIRESHQADKTTIRSTGSQSKSIFQVSPHHLFCGGNSGLLDGMDTLHHSHIAYKYRNPVLQPDRKDNEPASTLVYHQIHTTGADETGLGAYS